MRLKLFVLSLVTLIVAVPQAVYAQSCSSSELANLGACAYEAAQECRALYPSCSTTGQKQSQVITQQDVLNSIASVCCVDSKTTQQQKRCLKAKVNAQVLRYNLLKAVAATSFRPAILSAIRNLNELKREGCSTGSIVD